MFGEQCKGGLRKIFPSIDAKDSDHSRSTILAIVVELVDDSCSCSLYLWLTLTSATTAKRARPACSDMGLWLLIQTYLLQIRLFIDNS